MPEVSDHRTELDGLPVFWRAAPAGPAQGGEAARGGGDSGEPGGERGRAGGVPLYLHGVPTNSDDWLEMLAAGGGIAPDLPGFGRSGKPGSLAYTIDEYDRFIERFLDELGIERVRMLVHDWGGVGLAFAQRCPARVERLAIVNCVPFLPGYRWHRIARIWRTPLLGELAMGTTTRFTLRQSSREANTTPGPMPDSFIDSVIDHFDQGTQRAILRLYRSSPSDVLAAAGARLSELRMPTLVAWGMRDPYIPSRFGRAFAEAIPGAELLELDDAGHWPWLDRPDLSERLVAFLTE